MASRAYFSPRLFKFLKELERNNDRAWFQANKGRYEADVRAPMLSFIGDFAGPLKKISPHFIADPKPSGGSMFRIHRDTRFSKDKRPYKTSVSAQFRHDAGKDVHAPGFYLHLEPGSVFVGAGLYRPDPTVAHRVREAIADDPKGWRRATSGASFEKLLYLSGESMKRPPRGYDPSHPLVEDLKRKDFIVMRKLSEKDACSAAFQKQVLETCRAAKPLLAFLTRALDLEF